MKTNYNKILEYMKSNNGYIDSKTFKSLGINKNILNKLKTNNEILNISRGLYIIPNTKRDLLYELHLTYPSIIYSHTTALYLHGFIKNNESICITVNNKYHNYNINKYNVFYVSKNLISIGLINLKTKLNNQVLSYDLDRSICDIIRCSHDYSKDFISSILVKYQNSKQKNLANLYKYASIFGILKKVNALLN